MKFDARTPDRALRSTSPWGKRLFLALCAVAFVAGAAGNARSTNLTPPLLLSPAGGSVPDMAVDRFGYVHVVWRGADSYVWYAQVSPTGSIAIGATKVYDFAKTTFSRIAVDSAGDAHIITTSTSVPSFLIYIKVSNGVRVLVSAFTMFPLGLFDSEADYSPSIAVNPITDLPVVASEVQAYYTVDIGGIPVVRYNSEISAISLDAAGDPDRDSRWSPYYLRNNTGPEYRAEYVDVAVDSQGATHCVWKHRDPEWTGYSVGYARSGEDTWTEIANNRNVTSMDKPKIVRGATNVLDIVWSTTASQVIWQEINNSGSTILDDCVVSGADAQASRARVAAGFGKVYFGWADLRDGTNQIYVRKNFGSEPETNVTFTTGSAFNHALGVRGNAFALTWQDNQSGSNQVYYRTEAPCTVQLTVRDTDNLPVVGCRGEYYVTESWLDWSTNTDSSGSAWNTNSTASPVAFCRTAIVSSRIDVHDADSGTNTIQWDTPVFPTEGGGIYSNTITLNNPTGTNTAEGGVALRELMRAWNYVNANCSFDRHLIVAYVDSTDDISNPPDGVPDVYCDGHNVYFPHGNAVLDNGPPSSAAPIDDTMLHEYGHSTMYESYGHSFRRPTGCLCINHGGTSNDCSHDALVEGWATYFPVMVYHHISPGDTHYDWSGRGSRKDLESNAVTSTEERDEDTVAGVLWDIYDSVNDEGDTLSLGDDEIWAVMIHLAPATFEAFFQGFIKDHSEHAAALEQICIAHGMHPNWLTLSRTAIDFGVSSTQQTFTIQRVGWYGDGTPAAVTPDWSIEEDAAWITSVSPTNGVTTTGTNTITVIINTNALSDGLNTGYLKVTPGHYGRQQIITVTATKPGTPTISVTPPSQDFGSIEVDTTAERTFSVQNVGVGTLSGSASVPAPYSIISGGTYNLATGASQTVVVRYNPTVPGTHNQTVTFLGGGGTARSVTGRAFSDSEDSDGDGMSDWAEIVAGTNPNNPASYLRAGILAWPSSVDVFVDSFTSRYYTLSFCTNLLYPEWSNLPGRILVPGVDGLLWLSDTNAVSSPTRFYRVSVGMP